MNMPKLIVAGLIVAIGLRCGPCIAAEAPKPRNGEKLIVINDDGFSAFHSGRYKNAEDLRKAMLAHKNTQVAVMEWCMIAGSRANGFSR